jgi:Fe2+ transport system protein FeoA
MTLAELKVGEQGKVIAVNGQGALRRRLLDMGIIPNTMITVKKLAPMGDPMELSLRGYVLTIRKEDAAKIEVIQ